MNHIEIANTIQKQLKITVGIPVIWSWGQYALQALSQEDLKTLNINNGLGALKFKVNGHHHKGHVLIVLNGVDTYDVYICSIRAGKINTKYKIEGLYFDQIGNWIDENVEKIEEYNY